MKTKKSKETEVLTLTFTKKDIMCRLGLNPENFNFYLQMGHIKAEDKNRYSYNPKMEEWILEKSTVFRYHYEDNYQSNIRLFKKVCEYTGKVKKFTKEEIKAYEEQRRIEEEKKKAKQ